MAALNLFMPNNMPTFRREQKRDNLWFRALRKGQTLQPWTDAEKAVADAEPLWFPRTDTQWARQLHHHRGPITGAFVDDPLHGPGWNVPTFDDIQNDMNNALDTARSLARDMATRFRFAKILGKGGLGVAALFSHLDANGRATGKRYVIKRSLANDARTANGMRREKIMQEKFARARHVVQIEDPAGAQAVLAQTPCTIILEYCARGNMHQWLEQMTSDGQYPINEDILWNIFDCLTKSLIGMEYPPIRNPPTKDIAVGQAGPNAPRQGDKVTETVPSANPPSWRSNTNCVHFDLEPKNIFIGELDSRRLPDPDSHRIVPPFKIADFGLANRVTATSPNRVQKMWNWRQRGKETYYFPEQFTKEWEWVDLTPRNRLIAGQYGSKSNIYSIGLSMAAAMTGHYPPYQREPPNAGGAAQIPLPDPGSPSLWTYGAYLDDPRWNPAGGAGGPPPPPAAAAAAAPDDDDEDEDDETTVDEGSQSSYGPSSSSFSSSSPSSSFSGEDLGSLAVPNLRPRTPGRTRRPRSPRPYFSPELKRLVQWCLCEDPRDRPNLEDLQDRIETHLATRRVAADYVDNSEANPIFGFPMLRVQTRKARDVNEWLRARTAGERQVNFDRRLDRKYPLM
ncbi:hypothetical protein OQA88_2909 [Cercophora sp. LCS_1]